MVNSRWNRLHIAALLISLLACAISVEAQRKATRKPPVSRAAPSPTEEDRKAIEELHQQDIEANMAYDINSLANLWDDDIVSLPPGQPPLIGKDANLDFLKRGQEAMAQVEILGYTEDWREVRQVGDYAFEWGIIRSRTRTGRDTMETEHNFKMMRVLKRQAEGSWKIYRTIWNELPEEKGLEKPKP